MAAYWLLRCYKDPLFSAFVGAEEIWRAKLFSVFVSLPLVLVYSFFITKVSPYRLLIFFSLFCIGAFFFLGYLVASPVIGLWGARSAWIGWVSYVFIEAFGTFFEVLFYSILADTVVPAFAAQAYLFIAFFARIGQLFGSSLMLFIAYYVASWVAFIFGALLLLFVVLVVWLIVRLIPKKEYRSKRVVEEDRRRLRFFKGVRLLVSDFYFLLIFLWVASYEVLVIMFDLQFKVLIDRAVAHNLVDFITWTSGYGIAIAAVSLFALLGFVQRITRKMGMPGMLLGFPAFLVAMVVVFYVSSWFFDSRMLAQIVGVILVVVRGLYYAVGHPAKERLYLPLSRVAKYNSKVWVDVFGQRGSKAFGAVAVGIISYTPLAFLAATGTISLLWLFVGRRSCFAFKRKEELAELEQHPNAD